MTKQGPILKSNPSLPRVYQDIPLVLVYTWCRVILVLLFDFLKVFQVLFSHSIRFKFSSSSLVGVVSLTDHKRMKKQFKCSANISVLINTLTD